MDCLENRIKKFLHEIEDHLEYGIIPFWTQRGVDDAYGGFLTCFDAEGKPAGDTDKYIVTQTRMIWGLSALYRAFPDNQELLIQAIQGVDFFIKYFWDEKNGGWFWKVGRDGSLLDDGKVVYGQSFAIYALSEFFLTSGDGRALEYAEKTFDLLQKYCTDTIHGGYYENLEFDWSISAPEFPAGDRKSLDVHMHLMEAFTTLLQCTGKEIHRRKLTEVAEIILTKMLNISAGCGLNQFNTKFNPIPAINIRRTWNAERATGEVVGRPMDTTSYGHNVELAWLLNRAGDVLEKPFDFFRDITAKLVDHSLKYGFDYAFGGVYRDGPHEGPALVTDKEWWQNCEVLVGYLDAFERFGEEKYFDAFQNTWEFDKKYMINYELGEWRQLLKRDGSVLVGDVGNPWKAIYHTGRAMIECIYRLKRISKIIG